MSFLIFCFQQIMDPILSHLYSRKITDTLSSLITISTEC